MSQWDPTEPNRVNAVSVSVVLVVLSLAYVGAFLGPTWLALWKLSGKMQGTCYDAKRIHDDEVLLDRLLDLADKYELPEVYEDHFVISRYDRAGDLIEPQESQPGEKKKRRAPTVVIVIDFVYDVELKWPFLQRKSRFHFDLQREADFSVGIHQVEYGCLE